jgi:hypothetical protein
LIVAIPAAEKMETVMNHELHDQDETLIDLGVASTETRGSQQPNLPDGPVGFLINGGITED